MNCTLDHDGKTFLHVYQNDEISLFDGIHKRTLPNAATDDHTLNLNIMFHSHNFPRLADFI